MRLAIFTLLICVVDICMSVEADEFPENHTDDILHKIAGKMLGNDGDENGFDEEEFSGSGDFNDIASGDYIDITPNRTDCHRGRNGTIEVSTSNQTEGRERIGCVQNKKESWSGPVNSPNVLDTELAEILGNTTVDKKTLDLLTEDIENITSGVVSINRTNLREDKLKINVIVEAANNNTGLMLVLLMFILLAMFLMLVYYKGWIGCPSAVLDKVPYKSYKYAPLDPHVA
uniref:Uncharacterized LOC104266412 n=1 Tax=Ciona intestinalis TaxID=7719 RepID=F6RQY8_CIOIN|nr:uncharacterized protein LOC104266412 [Ciona intestinalis]|eukprot:XP_009860834.1 uncharacterized protein LOC104266412 [Ciona intestinalis]